MAELRELTTDAKRLYEALEYLLDRQEADKDEIDLKEIWFSAKTRPFSSHVLCDWEEVEQRRYLDVLAALISLGDDVEKRTIQMRFLARILAACGDCGIELGELLQEGRLLQEKSLDELQEINDEDLMVCLMVDLFLMIYLDGKPGERQLDFAVGFMAYMGIAEEMACTVGNVVKGLLEQDDAFVLRQTAFENVEYVYCYMKNPPDGIIVRDLEEGKIIETEKIIFYENEWKRLEFINFDEFQAEEIEFVSCTFREAEGFYNRLKKVRFVDCKFIDCIHGNFNRDHSNSYERYKDGGGQLFFMNMSHTTLERVVFENCTIEGYASESSVVNLEESIVKESKFTGCKVGIYAKGSFVTAHGSVLHTYNTTIEKSEFISCHAYGEGGANNYEMRIVEAMDGEVTENMFENCGCHDSGSYQNRHTHYILAFDKDCFEDNNIFEECESFQQGAYHNSPDHKYMKSEILIEV